MGSISYPQFLFNHSERTDFADVNCHWCTAPYIGMHSHTDWYEIIIATEVEFHHRIGTLANYTHHVGEVYILKPGVLHGLFGIGDGKAIHYNIAIKTAYFDSFIRNKDCLKKHFQHNDTLSFTLPDITFRYVRSLIDKIDNEQQDAFGNMLIETVLHDILLAGMESLQWAGMEGAHVTYYCKDALAKIDNTSYLRKSAAEIYSIYPVSHTAFIAEFKRICGYTPSQYLVEKKLEYAKTLLLTTNLSVLQIAEELNYSAVSYLIRKFKARYGMTPYQLRLSNNAGGALEKQIE